MKISEKCWSTQLFY